MVADIPNRIRVVAAVTIAGKFGFTLLFPRPLRCFVNLAGRPFFI